MNYEWSAGAKKLVAVERLDAAAKRRKGWTWTPISLADITNRDNDWLYPARTRLLLLLRIKSYDGKHSVVLTNGLADEIGIDRQRKWKLLQELEASGLVKIERIGLLTVRVKALAGGRRGQI